MVPGPHGHDIILDSFQMNLALKFTVILQNLIITANHRKIVRVNMIANYPKSMS